MSRLFELGEYWITRRKNSPYYFAAWYDSDKRTTKHTSLRTDDLEEAKIKLSQLFIVHGKPRRSSNEQVLLSYAFARYWKLHAKDIPSFDAAQRSMNYGLDFYGDITIKEIEDIELQEEFIDWMFEKGVSTSYVRRIIGVIKTAIRFSYKRNDIQWMPYIQNVPEGDPRSRILAMDEIARLFNAAEPGSSDFMYLILAFNTMARPGAIMELKPRQVDLDGRLVNLLVPGTVQTKKRRPCLPITDTLLPWLTRCDGETFVHYHGRQIKDNKKSFGALLERAGLKGEVCKTTIRHTMSTQLAKRGVPEIEIEHWLGHTKKSTANHYIKFAPDYLSTGRVAIDQFFHELQPLVNYPLTLTDINRKVAV